MTTRRLIVTAVVLAALGGLALYSRQRLNRTRTDAARAEHANAAMGLLNEDTPRFEDQYVRVSGEVVPALSFGSTDSIALIGAELLPLLDHRIEVLDTAVTAADDYLAHGGPADTRPALEKIRRREQALRGLRDAWAKIGADLEHDHSPAAIDRAASAVFAAGLLYAAASS